MPSNTKHLLSPRQAFVTAFLLIVSLAAQNRNPLAPAEERKTAVNLGDTACSLSIQSISKSVYPCACDAGARGPNGV
jgi:hypothetical protein